MTTSKFEHSEIEKMLTEISPWPWEAVEVGVEEYFLGQPDGGGGYNHFTDLGDIIEVDADFIAHSPQIISQLLEEVKGLETMCSLWSERNLEQVKKIEEQDQQIQILKEAMEKIIEYTSFKDKDFGQCMTTSGALAQEALAKLNQVKGEGE